MADGAILEDYEVFGRLVRHRRRHLGLSQEALASEALGNPDRKSFVSAIENARLDKITPNTAQKLSGPLGLTLEDVPASLRWPVTDDPSPIEKRLRALEAQMETGHPAIDDRVIARFLNRQMAAVLERSMSELFLQRLSMGLDALRTWTGKPFSLQSVLTCYALSLIYLVMAGLASFLVADITIGSIRPFRMPGWVGPDLRWLLPYFGLALLFLSVFWCCRLLQPFGTRPLTTGEAVRRLGGAALLAGLTCGVIDYLGATTMTAAAVFAVPCIGAISTLRPGRAALYGAAGGIIFGLMAAVSSGFTDSGIISFLKSLSEGFIIGGIVGSCAGLVSSRIAERIPSLRPSQIAGAGGGVGLGALASLAGIVVALQFSAINEGMLGLFAISWLALPLANAALDFISLGVSHTIGRHLVQSGSRGSGILAYLILDLTLAVLFMVLTVVVVGVGLHAITWGLGVETLPETFLTNSARDPWGDGLWLTIMALTTTFWTWLHLAFVLAPLAAGALIRQTIDKTAARRIAQHGPDSDFDASAGVLVSLRFVLFYACWAAIAMAPVVLLSKVPQLMEPILWTGWRLLTLVM